MTRTRKTGNIDAMTVGVGGRRQGAWEHFASLLSSPFRYYWWRSTVRHSSLTSWDLRNAVVKAFFMIFYIIVQAA